MPEAKPNRAIRLSDLLENPELLQPPEAVAPRLGFVGRVVLLAAREKMGKSTLVSAAAAAVSSGAPFLGEATRRGDVLLFWLEEHPGELAQNILKFGGDPDRVWVYTQLSDPRNPLREITEEIEALEPALVVIDSLSALAADVVTDTWNAGQWTRLLMPLVLVARSGPSIIFLHHSRKSDGAYRDSSGIGAAVDMILEMKGDSTDARARKIKAIGRFPLENFTVRLDETGSAYDLVHVDGEDLRPLVLLHLFEHPEESKRGVRESVKGDNKSVDEALEDLERIGIVENAGDRARAKFVLEPKALSYLEDTPTVNRARSCILSWSTLREGTVLSCKIQDGSTQHAQQTVRERAGSSSTVYFGRDLLSQDLWS